MKVPNWVALDARRNISLSRLQNEGSQPAEQGNERVSKSIKATE